MPLHIPIAGFQITIYEANGTSGKCHPPAKGSALAVIPEMTKTLALETGDKVMITFQADISIKARAEVEYAIRANGEIIGYTARDGSGGSTYWSSSVGIYNNYISRTYTAVADGDVVFDVVWRMSYGDEDYSYVRENERKLTLMVLG